MHLGTRKDTSQNEPTDPEAAQAEVKPFISTSGNGENRANKTTSENNTTVVSDFGKLNKYLYTIDNKSYNPKDVA